MALNNTKGSSTSYIPTYDEWVASPEAMTESDKLNAGSKFTGTNHGSNLNYANTSAAQDAYYKMAGEEYLKRNKPFERILRGRHLPSIIEAGINDAPGVDYGGVFRKNNPLALDHAIQPVGTAMYTGATESSRDKHARILTLAMDVASQRYRSPQEAMSEARRSIERSPGMVEQHQDYVILDIPGRGRVQLTKEAYDKHYAKHDWAKKQVEKDGRTGTKKPTVHDPNQEYFVRQ
jgi:hypothetical protein